MSSMMEIYERHADRYDELVRAEDYRGNLWRTLSSLTDWQGRRVVEAGTGTGRVTALYVREVAQAVCFDRSPHMLDYARRALAAYAERLTFTVADNRELPRLDETFDVFVEGWSFGHGAMDTKDDDELHRTADLLIRNAAQNVRVDGHLIIIETLGTNVDEPAAPHETLQKFYDYLEGRHGFARHEVRTDYRFETVDDAARIMGFFFGPEMEASVRSRGAVVVPEWTGVWARTVA